MHLAGEARPELSNEVLLKSVDDVTSIKHGDGAYVAISNEDSQTEALNGAAYGTEKNVEVEEQQRDRSHELIQEEHHQAVKSKQKTSRYNDIDMLSMNQFEFQNHQEPRAGVNLRILNSNSAIQAKIKKSSPNTINQLLIGTRKNNHRTNQKNCSSNQSVGRSNDQKDKSTLSDN